MITDALEGKIDLILTKSVSRFARNTVDSLTTVRALKDKGVEVYFEKENIWTLDSKGELLITIMSSLAQEESRSISENITWGKRKQFQDGKVTIPAGNMLGFTKNPTGGISIDPEGADLVRRIYHMFLEGNTTLQIARTLTAEGIPTPRGKTTWQHATIRSILTNEKYKGDALLQKTFTTCFLTKKTKINEGEIPQYYVTGSHPAIIPPHTWELVQTLINARKPRGGRAQRTFTGILYCAHCGAPYGSKTWHSTSKYKRIVWKCNNLYTHPHPTNMPTLYDQDIENAWIRATQTLITRQNLIDHELIQRVITDTTELDARISQLEQTLDALAYRISKTTIPEDLHTLHDEYNRTYETLNEAQEERKQRTQLQAKLHTFATTITNLEEITTFDAATFHALTSRITVNIDATLTIEYTNGTTI